MALTAAQAAAKTLDLITRRGTPVTLLPSETIVKAIIDPDQENTMKQTPESLLDADGLKMLFHFAAGSGATAGMRVLAGGKRYTLHAPRDLGSEGVMVCETFVGTTGAAP